MISVLVLRFLVVIRTTSILLPLRLMLSVVVIPLLGASFSFRIAAAFCVFVLHLPRSGGGGRLRPHLLPWYFQ
jgi:hypothetical protein